MPTRKIREYNNNIKERYYAHMDIRDTIEYAKALLARLNNGDYQGLVKTPALDTINENDNKDDELMIESEDQRKQRLLKEGFFAVPAWPDKNNKLKYGGEFKNK